MTVSYRIDRRAHQARLRAVLEGYAPRGPVLPVLPVSFAPKAGNNC